MRFLLARFLFTLVAFALTIAFFACGSEEAGRPAFDTSGTGDPNGNAAPTGSFDTEASAPKPPPLPETTSDTETCEEAKKTRSYVGCDYWPTVNANLVYSVFDFAVVVANTNKAPATLVVTGPNGVNQTTTV